MNPKTTNGPGRQAGLTLMEILIALGVGLFIMAAVIQMFVSSRQINRTQEAMSRIQENGRFAMELLARDVRQVGFLGCQSNLISETPRSEGPLGPGRVRNTLNPDPPAAPAFVFDFSAPIQGYEYDTANSNWSPALPSAIANADPAPLADRDVITLRRAEGVGSTVTAHPGGNPPGSAAIRVEAGSGIQIGDILMVSDCEQAAIFQATNVQSASGNQDNIVHNTGGSQTPGNWTQQLGKSFVEGEVYRVESNTYYIANGDTNLPGLFRLGISGPPQELVEGVRDMQIIYGIDLTGNRIADQYVVANDANWAANRVVSARISLLLMSPENNVVDEEMSLPYNGGTFDAPTDDRRMYQVFTTTIGLRNRLP